MIFKTRQQGERTLITTSFFFFVMIFPLAIVLTWMKEVLKTIKEKKLLNKKYRTQRRMKNMTMTTIIILITKQSMVRATVTVAKMRMIRVIMNTMRRMKNMMMTMIIISRTKQSMV